MDRTKATPATNYKKFIFPSKEKAEHAKSSIDAKYPTLKTAITENGSFFVDTKGSLILGMEILADVIALGGGVEA